MTPMATNQFAQPYEGVPTPNPTRVPLGEGIGSYRSHVVGWGESLGYIAALFHTTVEELQSINGISDGEFLNQGQTILVPTSGSLTGPAFKIIPDNELYYGPSARGFDLHGFVEGHEGYLAEYVEYIEYEYLSGSEIVDLVSSRFSVNPRVLLALLEYRTGWVTGEGVLDDGYPLGFVKSYSNEGLYNQLAWASSELNWGFYSRSNRNITSFMVSDGTRVTFAGDINDGTAAVQNALGSDVHATLWRWQQDVGPDGLYATFEELFGNPFGYTVEEAWPDGLEQPNMELPWPEGETWYFTGGPHAGWADGSPWAALDFVDGSDELGCYFTDDWLVAAADGVISRSSKGAVVIDLDGDGFSGTGWALIYMHVETRDRVELGTRIKSGDRVGHPSCEGGFSNGTHVHLSRTYNGRWIAADGPIPFALEGWTSVGLDREYDGQLVREDQIRTACECRLPLNGLTAGRDSRD